MGKAEAKMRMSGFAYAWGGRIVQWWRRWTLRTILARGACFAGTTKIGYRRHLG